MLDRKITRIVLQHVKQIVNQDKKIEVLRNAAFEDLCESTNMWLPDETGLTVFNAIPKSLEVAQEHKTNTIHAATQMAIVSELTNRTVGATGYIKGTVIDAVVDCREYVMKSVEDGMEGLANIVIKERTIPEIVYSTHMPVDLAIETHVTELQPYRLTSHVDISEATTGVPNSELTAWRASSPSVEAYGHELFSGNVTRSQIMNTASRLSTYDRIDYGMTLILGSTAILNNPEQVTTMGLEELRSVMHGVRNYGKSLTSKALRLVNMSLKLNKLVISNERNCITVNANIYEQYLDDGGTADAMMGRCVANDNVNTKNGVLEKVVEYTALNRRNAASLESAYRKMTLKHTKYALRTWASKHMKELETPQPVDKQYGLRLANAAIESLTISDIKDTYTCSKNIVAKNLYYFTNANEYLSYMDEALKTNPELSAEEASMVATMETLCDYAAGNLSIEDI